MGVAIPDAVREKLQAPSFWHLATVAQSGAPTTSPVWVDLEDDHVLVNTAIGRLKERNARANPRVALSHTEPGNPYERTEIRGRIVDYVEGEPADRSIDRLAKKYLDADSYPFRKPDEQRLLLRIEPTKITYETG